MDEGFSNLLNIHTNALEENSKKVVEILELLTNKSLSIKDRNTLKKMKKEIATIDNRLDDFDGKTDEFKEEDEESWWE